MKTYNIEVTDADIAAGLPKRCLLCPIAIALNRTLGRPKADIKVGWGQIQMPDGTSTSLPQLAIDFVRAFDYGKPVSPFTFEIEVDL